MKPQIGKYYFGRHYSVWGIWQWELVNENGSASAKHIKDVRTYTDAVREVYCLNGWGTPKQIRRIY